MESSDLKVALTLHLWDEAWEQSRHLENMRSQYLGFFFAAMLSVTALTGNGLVGHHASRSSAIVLATGLQMLALYLYVATVRVNQVSDHYVALILAIAQKTSLDAGIDLSPPSPPRSGRLGRVLLWHGTELVLPLAAGGLTVALIINASYALSAHGTSTLAQIASGVALTSSLIAAAFCYWLLHPTGRRAVD
jgi:hypothetical protein